MGGVRRVIYGRRGGWLIFSAGGGGENGVGFVS